MNNRREISMDEFFSLIPREGWKLTTHGNVIFDNERGECPMLYVRDVLGHRVRLDMDENPEGWEQFYRAADNDSNHDPALRARLLAHCGLAEAACQ